MSHWTLLIMNGKIYCANIEKTDKAIGLYRLSFLVEEITMKNYKTRIAQAKTSFELSCIWEEVRNAYFNKKTISKEMYEKRSAEIIARRRSL